MLEQQLDRVENLLTYGPQHPNSEFISQEY